MITEQALNRQARRVADLLRQQGRTIVFAESCTGGLVAAKLTRIAGISEFLCGSAVVYQNTTKAGWLGISPKLLEKPGPVSRTVAIAMAEGVLQRTPHADLAAAITGHLGPAAPKRMDGLIWGAVAVRRARQKPPVKAVAQKHRLPGEPDRRSSSWRRTLRVGRQRAAANFLLTMVQSVLEEQKPPAIGQD
jgi:PncC family amidohydrolase